MLRDVRVQGRRDGFSKSRRPSRSRQDKQSQPDERPAVPSWWEDDYDLQPAAASNTSRNVDDRQFDRTARAPPAVSRQPSSRSRQDDEDDDEGKGWWENPAERSLQAYAPDELDSWQIKKLEQAYAIGKRKIKIKELSDEINVDRSYILHWLKEFSLRPEEERTRIVSQRLRELQAEQAQQAAEQLAAEQHAVLGVPQNPSSSQPAPQMLGASQGFIPFFTRKEQGLTDVRNKRLSAEALRTLELVYSRTPFPSNDVIRSLWDLHRLNRDAALTWFQARRAAQATDTDAAGSKEQADGPGAQRSRSGQAASTSGRAAAGSEGAGRGEAEDHSGSPWGPPGTEAQMSPRALRQAMGNLKLDGNNLLVRAEGGPGAQQGAGTTGAVPQPEQVLVGVTKRQLAQMRSSLPSPNKRKGAQRNEAMGVTPGKQGLVVGNVEYVAIKDVTPLASRWSRGWRARRAVAPARMLPLLAEPLE